RSLRLKTLQNGKTTKKRRSGSLESTLKSDSNAPTIPQHTSKVYNLRKIKSSGRFLGGLLYHQNISYQSSHSNTVVRSSPRKEIYISKYYVKFSSVFQNPEFKTAFMDHLRQEYILEQFEFLLAVQHFNETNERVEKLKIFFEI